MIDYSFMVTTYNQEEFVKESLDSIKYQMVNYGEGYNVQLVIGDDASQDKTPQFIQEWLDENGYLFKDIYSIFRTKNVGTCKNYCDLIRKLKAEKFRELSGDDMISHTNVFEMMDMLDDIDVVQPVILLMKDGELLKSSKDYQWILRSALYSTKQLHFLTKVETPIYNGTLFRKSLLTEEILQHIEKYKLIEDWPMWYYIFKFNPNISHRYIPRPGLFYRRYGESVTATRSDAHINDIRGIRNEIMGNENSWMVNFVLRKLDVETGHMRSLLRVWEMLIYYFNYKKLSNILKMAIDEDENCQKEC